MAKLSFKKNKFSTVSIPSIFIEKHMPKANGTFVKVYLYGLLYSSMTDVELTNKDIAQALDIIESDVYSAWKYWEKAGIIKINNSNDDMDIEFLDLLKPEEPKFEVQQTKPTYHPKELDIYINNNSEISYLFKVAQEKLGKPLSPSDSNTLFGFYDWLRLPVEVIVMLLEYCASNDKRSMRYIEKVAIDWAEKGIDDHHKAEEYLKRLEFKNSQLNIISKALGLSTLTPAHLSFIEKWLNEYKLSIDVIKLACEKTILNTGKPSFEYINSILEDWKKKNIKTVDDAVKEQSNFKESYNKSSKPAQPKASKNNKFINFTQRSTDFDEIARIIAEKDLKESRSS